MTTVAARIKSTAIQTPRDGNPEQHTIVLRQLKEALELGQRLRGDPADSFVRVSELVHLGILRLVGATLQLSNSTPPATL